MTTDPKKLPTIEGFTPGPWTAAGASVLAPQGQVAQAFGPTLGESGPNARLIASAPDLYRIVHEQREVIEKQDAALRAALEPLELYHAYGWPDRAGVRAELKAAIAAAAPYILED